MSLHFTKYAGRKKKKLQQTVRVAVNSRPKYTFLITQESYDFSCVIENQGYCTHNGV
jgi:hypothetical protein